MRWIVIFCLMVSAFFVQAQNSRNAQRFLLKAAAKNLKKSHNSYQIIPNSTIQDTISVSWKKNPSDVFFGYDAFISNSDSTAYYSLDSRFLLYHSTKTIDKKKFLDPKLINPNLGPFDSTGYSLYFSEFLRPDSSLWLLVKDTSLVFGKRASWFLSSKVEIEIQKKSFSTSQGSNPKRIILTYKRHKKKIVRIENNLNSTAYGAEIVSSSFDSDSIENLFTDFSLPNTYVFKQSSSKTKDTIFWLTNPVVIEDFEFLDYSGNSHRLSDYRGKVVVLDFWYATCAPCIKASKYVEEMIHTYSYEKFIVLGMNPIDSKEKNFRTL